MHVVQVNGAWDADLDGPEALIERCDTLLAWSRALLEAGAARATVVQRFAHDAQLTRDGVGFVFRRDGARPFPRPWRRLPRLAAALGGCAPDVAHVNGLLFPGLTRGLRRGLAPQAALVVQDHASQRPPRGFARRALWRHGLRGVDAFLFTAAEQAAPWRAAGLIAGGASVVSVPEASRSLTPIAYDEARAVTGLRGQPAVLWVGHLDANKDPLTVLEGFAGALADVPDAVLTLVFRRDDLRRAVQACLAAAPVLRARVELRGAVAPEQMPALYSAADLFALGSRREGSGYALMEALACGVLPVVTDIPSFRELTGGGRLGAPQLVPPLLWPAGDPAAFGRALVAAARAVREPGRRDVRDAVRRHFEREASWPAVAARALRAYESARVARQGAGSKA